MLNFYNRRTVEKKMRESIRKDRARIQRRISKFGIARNDSTKIKRGLNKVGTQLSLESFSQKILKKTQHLAFTEKVKIVKTYIPEKVKFLLKIRSFNEKNYFQKKYSVKLNLFQMID